MATTLKPSSFKSLQIFLMFSIFLFVSFSVCPLYSNVVQIFRISSTAPLVINSSLLSISTATDKHLREKSKGISSIFLYFSTLFSIPIVLALATTASSILLFSPVCK